MNPVFRATVPNSMDGLIELTRQVTPFLAENPLPPKVDYAVHLAIDEMVSNVIKYAHDDALPHDIRLELEVGPGGARFLIEDDGRPFDPTARPEPELDIDPSQRPVGGLGIHLVKSLAESMTYRRENGRNRVEVFFVDGPE